MLFGGSDRGGQKGIDEDFRTGGTMVKRQHYGIVFG